ncbi:gamma-interferon-inducible protein 16 isoform X3 [Prionailurus iriomotensis]
MVKSLLDSDLGLTPKMKEEYTKVKIADMMHKKFRGILCVNELLRLLKDIEGLEDTVKTIKNEKRKVMKKYKTQGLAPGKKRKQEVSSTDESTSTANKASRPVDDTLVSKFLDQGLKSVPTKPSREEGLQTCAKEVMVLKATEPFAYDITDEERRMFHATVVTESQFFRVKVFHVGLKDKFIPKRVITLADYIGRNGFLEVYNVSSVSDVSADRKMEVSSRLIQNANATPKIKELRLEEPGTFVSGVYQVHKKMVLDQCMTLYEIQDDTGTMDVLVYGRLTKVNCEKGDKLTLVCFELSRDPRQLRSVTHSFIKVTKPRKNKKQQLNHDLYMKTPA